MAEKIKINIAYFFLGDKDLSLRILLYAVKCFIDFQNNNSVESFQANMVSPSEIKNIRQYPMQSPYI